MGNATQLKLDDMINNEKAESLINCIKNKLIKIDDPSKVFKINFGNETKLYLDNLA